MESYYFSQNGAVYRNMHRSSSRRRQQLDDRTSEDARPSTKQDKEKKLARRNSFQQRSEQDNTSATNLKVEWMWGDVGPLSKSSWISKANPFRWSTAASLSDVFDELESYSVKMNAKQKQDSTSPSSSPKSDRGSKKNKKKSRPVLLREHGQPAYVQKFETIKECQHYLQYCIDIANSVQQTAMADEAAITRMPPSSHSSSENVSNDSITRVPDHINTSFSRGRVSRDSIIALPVFTSSEHIDPEQKPSLLYSNASVLIAKHFLAPTALALFCRVNVKNNCAPHYLKQRNIFVAAGYANSVISEAKQVSQMQRKNPLCLSARHANEDDDEDDTVNSPEHTTPDSRAASSSTSRDDTNSPSTGTQRGSSHISEQSMVQDPKLVCWIGDNGDTTVSLQKAAEEDHRAKNSCSEVVDRSVIEVDKEHSSGSNNDQQHGKIAKRKPKHERIPVVSWKGEFTGEYQLYAHMIHQASLATEGERQAQITYSDGAQTTRPDVWKFYASWCHVDEVDGEKASLPAEKGNAETDDTPQKKSKISGKSEDKKKQRQQLPPYCSMFYCDDRRASNEQEGSANNGYDDKNRKLFPSQVPLKRRKVVILFRGGDGSKADQVNHPCSPAHNFCHGESASEIPASIIRLNEWIQQNVQSLCSRVECGADRIENEDEGWILERLEKQEEAASQGCSNIDTEAKALGSCDQHETENDKELHRQIIQASQDDAWHSAPTGEVEIVFAGYSLGGLVCLAAFLHYMRQMKYVNAPGIHRAGMVDCPVSVKKCVLLNTATVFWPVWYRQLLPERWWCWENNSGNVSTATSKKSEQEQQDEGEFPTSISEKILAFVIKWDPLSEGTEGGGIRAPQTPGLTKVLPAAVLSGSLIDNHSLSHFLNPEKWK